MTIQSINLLSKHQLRFNRPVIACIGGFDGLHRGHQQIMKTCLKIVKTTTGAQSLFLTFFPQPKALFQPKHYFYLLPNQALKAKMCQWAGFDRYGIINFNHQVAKITALQFIKQLKRMNITHIVVGENFRFGAQAQGDVALLQQFFLVTVVKTQILNQAPISSTAIKAALRAGFLKQANQMLGYQYLHQGIVKHGEKLGRTIGFPTINLLLGSSPNLFPGVYLVYVVVKRRIFKGIACIFQKQNQQWWVETYILNFNQEVYDQFITIEFCHYLRENFPFSDLKSLQTQIKIDLKAMKILNQYKPLYFKTKFISFNS